MVRIVVLQTHVVVLVEFSLCSETNHKKFHSDCAASFPFTHMFIFDSFSVLSIIIIIHNLSKGLKDCAVVYITVLTCFKLPSVSAIKSRCSVVNVHFRKCIFHCAVAAYLLILFFIKESNFHVCMFVFFSPL